MDTAGFSQDQKEALLDLLIVGIYADHNLASAEDERLNQLLDTFSFESDYERQRISDAAFTRASRHTDSPEAARAYITQLATRFPGREIRQRVYDILADLLASDGNLSPEETKLLSTTKDVFQL
jgi:hypothetical protein